MSADERDSTALRAIESGATFFILKPICEDDNYRMYLQKMDSSENSSIQSNLASKKVGSSSLVSNSSNKMKRKSVGNMNAATSAQQLIHGKFAHQADHSGQSRDKELMAYAQQMGDLKKGLEQVEKVIRIRRLGQLEIMTIRLVGNPLMGDHQIGHYLPPVHHLPNTRMIGEVKMAEARTRDH
ncbi:hypothetical protein HAX54_030623 [Datura stramonium]|uniref:Response regulatory domain-containing protein n=1 Tax=Datura stramonium TaxID=4076 RepID=A0ABS8SB95_DATST|nr:hypothetical protein [Datura stramonium]